MRIASRLFTSEAADRRMFGRVASNIRARMGRAEQAQEVTVTELSRGGFRVEGGKNLEGGMDIAIDLPGLGLRPARVVWTVGRQAGCEFTLPIEDRQIEELLARHAPDPATPARPSFGRKRND